MHREHIRATPSWRRGPPRYDCVFVNSHPDLEGMHGLDVVRVVLFFSFPYKGITYPCAFVRWFSIIGEERDEETGAVTLRRAELKELGDWYVRALAHC